MDIKPLGRREKFSNIINLFFWVLVVAVVMIRGFWVNISSNLTFNAPWTIGEWLINYAGGFTRRGLLGAVIFHSSVFFDFPPWLIAVFASIVSWLILALLLWQQCRYRFRAVFLFSPFVMLAPLIGEYLIRKDCFNLALLAVSLVIAKPISFAGRRSRIVRLALINLLGIIAILSHESYIFYAFPSLMCIIQGLPVARRLKQSIGRVLRLALMLVPMLVAAGLCLYFHGDPRISEAIHRSWLIFADRHSSVYPVEPMGSVGAVGWSLAFGFNYTNKVILFELANGFIWRPFALLVTLLLLILIVTGPFALRDCQPSGLGRQVGKIFRVNLLFMTPIFVIGHDYGRWLFMIVVATVLVGSLMEFDAKLQLSCAGRGGIGLFRFHSSNLLVMLVPLFFGIPPYWNSWNLAWSAQSSWLGYLLLSVSKALAARFLGVYILALAIFVISILWIQLPNLNFR
jgi:hypothetical protein